MGYSSTAKTSKLSLWDRSAAGGLRYRDRWINRWIDRWLDRRLERHIDGKIDK